MKPDKYKITKTCANCLSRIDNRGDYRCSKHRFDIELSGRCPDWNPIKHQIKLSWNQIITHLKNGDSIKLTDGTEIKTYRELKKWGKERGLDLD